jgi:TonB family protein
MENAIKGDTTTDYDAEGDLSMNEIAAIRSQISQAWRVTAFSGGKDNKNMRVTVKIKVNEDGEVSDVKITEKSAPVGVDRQVYNAFIDSVMRAIRAASPLQNLPEDKYNTWNEMELMFDSSGMIY